MISVVVPIFNEEANVRELHKKLKEAVLRLGQNFEIIFVDDGSHDNTFNILKTLSPLKIIRHRRNFGQAAAVDAGISHAIGDIIVTMDGDLQNDPEDIGRLIAKINDGYDIVMGWRKDRHDSFFRKVHSRLANWLSGAVSGLHLHDHACAIRAYRRELFNNLNITLYGEMHIFLPVYLVSRGAKITEIIVKHHERTGGLSKHHFMRGVKAISDLFTARFISATIRPLLFFTSFALISFLLAVISTAASIYLKFQGLNFSQTPLPVIATLFIVVGFLLVMMGFLAELMIRIYYDTQHSKAYSIKEVIENK